MTAVQGGQARAGNKTQNRQGERPQPNAISSVLSRTGAATLQLDRPAGLCVGIGCLLGHSASPPFHLDGVIGGFRAASALLTRSIASWIVFPSHITCHGGRRHGEERQRPRP